MLIINKRQKTITQVKQQFVDESFNLFARIDFLMIDFIPLLVTLISPGNTGAHGCSVQAQGS